MTVCTWFEHDPMKGKDHEQITGIRNHHDYRTWGELEDTSSVKECVSLNVRIWD